MFCIDMYVNKYLFINTREKGSTCLQKCLICHQSARIQEYVLFVHTKICLICHQSARIQKYVLSVHTKICLI